MDKSGVYKLKCNDCDAVYIGQTGSFTTRIKGRSFTTRIKGRSFTTRPYT